MMIGNHARQQSHVAKSCGYWVGAPLGVIRSTATSAPPLVTSTWTVYRGPILERVLSAAQTTIQQHTRGCDG